MEAHRRRRALPRHMQQQASPQQEPWSSLSRTGVSLHFRQSQFDGASAPVKQALSPVLSSANFTELSICFFQGSFFNSPAI